MIAEYLKTQIKLHVVNLFAASIGWFTGTPGCLRILTFHDISNDTRDVYAVTKERFTDYLSLLKDEGYTTIRAGDLVADWPSVLSRTRVVLLTFDDGCVAQRDIAAELLTQRGMTATFFVISSMLGQNRSRCTFSGKERTFLSGEDLRQMVLGGFEIGSHSHAHPLLGMLPVEQVDVEVRFSKQIVEEAIGHEVISFAYPFGRRDSFSSMTRSVLEKNGYTVAFTQAGNGVKSTSDLLKLPRTNVDRFDTLTTFRRKLNGYYDFLGKA